MNPPPDERPIGLANATDLRPRDAGVEAPSHAHVDRIGVDGDPGEALAEADQAQWRPEPAVVPEPEDELRVAHEGTVPPRALTWRSLTLLFAVVAALRWWFNSNRTMFHMAADEPAQLAIARWLSGGTRWSMFDHSTWRPGMAVLLTPIFWFTDDTSTIMHYGLAVTAVLGGLAAVVCAQLALRITPMSARAAWLAAAVVALAPSSMSATAFVWAEGLVTLTFLGSLWYVLDYYDTRDTRSGIAAIVVAALGFTAHGRLLPMLTVVVALVLGRGLIARRWRQSAILAAMAVGAAAAAFGFGALVFDHVWDDPGSSNTVGTVMKRLPHIGDNLRSAVGQVWYQLVVTAGLFGVGLCVAVAAACRLRRRAAAPEPDVEDTDTAEAPPAEPVPAEPVPAEPVAAEPVPGGPPPAPAVAPPPLITPRDARVVLAMVVPLVVVSMVFMSGRSRADHEIYGRYNDAIVWPVLLVAFAWLQRLRNGARPLRVALAAVAIASATIASGFAVDRINHETFSESVGVRAMIAGLLPVLGAGATIPTWWLTVAGVIGFAGALVAALATRRGIVLALAAVAAIAVGGVRTHDALNTRLNSWGVTTEVRDIEALVPPGATLAVKFVADAEHPKVGWDDQRRRAQLYQFSLPDHPFLRDRGLDDDVGPYVFAPLDDPSLDRAGATVIWRDPRLQYGLWVEPDPDDPAEG